MSVLCDAAGSPLGPSGVDNGHAVGERKAHKPGGAGKLAQHATATLRAVRYASSERAVALKRRPLYALVLVSSQI